MKIKVSGDDLERIRESTHLKSNKILTQSEGDAVRFINSVGICMVFGAPDIELPSLWHSINGYKLTTKPTTVNADPSIQFLWKLKQDLPQKKIAYYGKVIKRQPTFLSLEMLACFYKLYAGKNPVSDVGSVNKISQLSETSQRIFDLIKELEPVSSRILAEKMEQLGRYLRPEFEKGLEELELKMYIFQVGTEDYPRSAIWGLTRTYFHLNEVNNITDDPMDAILKQYFKTRLVTTPKKIQQLFGWHPLELEKSLNRLLDQELINPVSVLGSRGKWLGWHQVKFLAK